MRKSIVASLAAVLLVIPAAAGAAPPGTQTSSSESAYAFVEGESEGSFFYAGLDAGSWEFSEAGYEEAWSGVSFFYEASTETGYVFCYASDETDVELDRRLTELVVVTTLTGECFAYLDAGEEPPPEGEVASVEHENGEDPGEEISVPITVTVDATWSGVGALSRSSWNSRGDGYVCKGNSTSRDAVFSATVEFEAEGFDLPQVDFNGASAGMDRWLDSCHEKGTPGPA